MALKLHFLVVGNTKLSARNWGHRFYFKEQWLEHEECQNLIHSERSDDFLFSAGAVRDKLI